MMSVTLRKRWSLWRKSSRNNICTLLRPVPFLLFYLCTCQRYFPTPVTTRNLDDEILLAYFGKVSHRGSRLPHLRSASGKYWDKYLLRPKRSCDRLEPTVGKLCNLKKTFPDFRIVKPYLDHNCNPESPPLLPLHPTPFHTKFPNPVLQKSLLFVENLLSALNGAWNLIVSSHFLSYCFVFFCFLRLFMPFLTCFIPASGFPDV